MRISDYELRTSISVDVCSLLAASQLCAGEDRGMLCPDLVLTKLPGWRTWAQRPGKTCGIEKEKKKIQVKSQGQDCKEGQSACQKSLCSSVKAGRAAELLKQPTADAESWEQSWT